MKNNDEAVKLIAKTVQENLTKFIGEKNTENTRAAITANMVNVLKSLENVMGLHAPLPTIQVDIHGNQASVRFFDPEHADEEISLSEWMARACEGYYD
jgi:hypothetical protein